MDLDSVRHARSREERLDELVWLIIRIGYWWVLSCSLAVCTLLLWEHWLR